MSSTPQYRRRTTRASAAAAAHHISSNLMQSSPCSSPPSASRVQDDEDDYEPNGPFYYSSRDHLQSTPAVPIASTSSSSPPIQHHQIPLKSRNNARRNPSMNTYRPPLTTSSPNPPQLYRNDSATSVYPFTSTSTSMGITSKSDALARAQAAGITPDQFEQAKQQVLRFLRQDATPPSSSSPVLHSLPQPSIPIATTGLLGAFERKRNANAPSLGRSASFVAVAPSTSSMFNTTTTLESRPVPSNGALPKLEYPSSNEDPFVATTKTNNASMERVVERTGERGRWEEEAKRERDVRSWAAQADASSSSSHSAAEEEDSNRPNTRARTRAISNTPKHPSSHHHQHHTNMVTPKVPTMLPTPAATSSAKRGMMERFMEEAGGSRSLVRDPSSSSSSSSGSGSGQVATTREEQPRMMPSSPVGEREHKRRRQAPPAPPTPVVEEDRMLTSPVRPRAMNTSVFASPDIGRVLKSELRELEERERSESASPRKRIDRSADIVVDDPLSSSPYRVRSIYSSGGASEPTKRTRDVFSRQDEEESVGKRSRVMSPSPALSAPSFCDSSPAGSDRAASNNINGGRGANFVQATYGHPHPASAPDYYHNHHHLPSLSPSSQGSVYEPPTSYQPQYRSSPGPSGHQYVAQQQQVFSRPPLHSHMSEPVLPIPLSTSVGSSSASSSAPRKRAPMKRADTAPLLNADGSHAKPGWSYAALIGQAVFSTEERKISLADIYSFIMKSYPYYKKEDSGWQNSIRHNLSLNECFIKTARGADNPGKGCLWAIAPGCEDQFADGGFTKRGAGSTRKSRNAPKSINNSQPPPPPPRYNPSGLLRSAVGAGPQQQYHSPPHSQVLSPAMQQMQTLAQRRGRDSSPVAINSAPLRSSSPAMSIHSARGEPVHSPMYSPALSHHSFHEVVQHQQQRVPTPLQQQQSYPEQQPQRIPTPQFQTQRPVSQPVQAPSPVPSIVYETTRPASVGPVVQQQQQQKPEAIPRRMAATSPSECFSPPTSVYSRLANGYQPNSSYSHSTAQSSRALALLASPEAGGIMPVHPSVYDRPLHPIPSHAHSERGSHFLPAPHIFPGGSRRAKESDDDEDKEDRPTSLLGHSAFTHTQSPISSVRGSRAPMSPVQNTDAEERTVAIPDPEKKRVSGHRHHPSVAALAEASDTFRTPPRLRSPSSRHQAILGTPVGARARAWATPGRGHGASPGSIDFGWGDPFGGRAEVEAELERFWLKDGEHGSSFSSSNQMTPKMWSPGGAMGGSSHW